MFVLLGLAGYVYSVILIVMIFFTSKNQAVFHRLRAGLALFLVILPGILGGAGLCLIRHPVTVSAFSLGIGKHGDTVFNEESRKLAAIYEQFAEDYQVLLEKREIKLPLDTRSHKRFLHSFRSHRVIFVSKPSDVLTALAYCSSRVCPHLERIKN